MHGQWGQVYSRRLSFAIAFEALRYGSAHLLRCHVRRKKKDFQEVD